MTLANSFHTLEGSNSNRKSKMWAYKPIPKTTFPGSLCGVYFKSYTPAISILENLKCSSITQQEMVSFCLIKIMREKSEMTWNKGSYQPTVPVCFKGFPSLHPRFSEGRDEVPKEAFRIQLKAMRCWKILSTKKSIGMWNLWLQWAPYSAI